MFHATLSPSPVHLAFDEIEWNAPIAVSNPEQSMLQSAEENPLEYTLADFEDAFLYTRLLLKVLDQVTGPSNPGIVSQLPLEQRPFDSVEQAHEYYTQDKTGVVTHYLITKLYEMIGLVLEYSSSSSSTTLQKQQQAQKVKITTLFYQNGKLLDDWRPLLRLLYRGGTGDAYSQRGAALCLAQILKAGCMDEDSSSPAVEETLQSLVSWLTSRLQSSNHHSNCLSLGVVTPTLVVLATCPKARLIFDQSGGIGYLTRHLRQFQQQQHHPSRHHHYRRSSSNTNLRSPPGSPGGNKRRLSQSQKQSSSSSSSSGGGGAVQQLYELCFCLWTMTYDCETHAQIKQHFHRDGAILALGGLLTTAPREKVTRLALSSLRNLAELSSQSTLTTTTKSMLSKSPSGSLNFVQEMIGCGIPKSIRLLRERQWTDPDILEDLKVLNHILQENYKELSRFEVYLAELETGRLEWGILHTEKFFRDNARQMEGPNGDFAPLKRLIQLLKLNAVSNGSQDEDEQEILAIACYDIGEFVRHYPNGKAIANRLGAKALIMPLMEHENQDVQRQALQCISKMLVQNWRAIDGM